MNELWGIGGGKNVKSQTSKKSKETMFSRYNRAVTHMNTQ